jgi:hypothetical protein
MSVDGMWYVKLADGDVDRVTLDQLDEAFQNGQVDENSMVLADGADTWMKLGDLLGGSEAAAPAPPPVVVQPPVAAPIPVLKQPPIIVQTAVAGRAPLSPGFGANLPFVGQQPLLTRPATAMMPVPITASLRPLSVDLGKLELGEPQFRGSSRKRWVVGMLGSVVVLGAGAFFVVTKTASSARADATPTFAAAAVQPPPAPVTPPPEPVAATSPQVNIPGPSSITDPTQRQFDDHPAPRLTDEQKRKLVETEKSAKSHAKSRGGAAGGSHGKEKSSGFTTDGNKFDPLNSSL